VQKTIYEYKRVRRDLTGFLGHGNALLVSAKDLVAWKAKMIAAGMNPISLVVGFVYEFLSMFICGL